jgi:thermitase
LARILRKSPPVFFPSDRKTWLAKASDDIVNFLCEGGYKMCDLKRLPISAPNARHVKSHYASKAKVHRAVMVFLMMTAAVALLPAALNAYGATPTAQSSASMRIVKGRVLVRPKAGLSTAQLDRILAAHGGKRVQHLTAINVHVIELPATANEMAVVKALQSNPNIKFAEPDGVLDPSLTVNDQYYSQEWHLPKIGAPAAWDTRTGAGATIAILDSGVDAAHPDLTAQLVPGWNTYDNNNNTADVYGHGTQTAGTAGAAGNNTIGVASVAFGSKIMPIRITDTSGYAYYSTMANGITWAADHGARVASISFLGVTASSTVLSAAQYMRSKGGVVVAAAGNTGALESYPATDYVTSVSASDTTNSITSWSSYGSYVDLAAPGVGIYTTAQGGGYASVSGTSFSSPVVAGVYGLMISANPTLGPTQLDGIIFSTATDIGPAGKDDKSGWGVVNASAAVTQAVQTTATDSTAPTDTITSPTASTKVSGLAPVDVSATDNIAVTRVELYVNSKLYATETVAPYNFIFDTTGFADGSATLFSKAYDAAGNAGTSASVAVTIANDTIAPVVTIQSPANGSTVTGTVTVAASATDNNKVAQISLKIDGKEVALAYSSSLSYSWNTGSTSTKGKTSKKSSTTSTSHTLVVTATDPAGNIGTQSISVTSQ